MSRSLSRSRWPLLATVILAASALTTPAVADVYDAAVQHTGRSDRDVRRDALDHPAELLRLAQIHSGQRVLDMLGGDGYYSELASYIVGPRGHVLFLNNPSFERWAGDDLPPRLAHGRLPNVEHRVADWSHLALGHGTFDAVLLVKVYHDLYWVDDEKPPTVPELRERPVVTASASVNWPKVPVNDVLDEIVAALKPGGVLLLIDHSAKPGTGSADASSLHRIDEAFARKDFESRGLRVIATSDLLRSSADPRELISYKPPMLGKTDRFVLVFRKG